MLELKAYNVHVSLHLQQTVYLHWDNNTWNETREDNHKNHKEAEAVNLLQIQGLVVGGGEHQPFTLVSMRNQAAELAKGIR